MFPLAKEILSLFFPQSEDEKCIARYTQDEFLKKYHEQKRGDCAILSSFGDSAVRASIHLNKFHRHKLARELLSALVIKFLLHHVEQVPCVLIPIPLSSRRHKKRGHNQVTSVLAKACSSFSYITLDTQSLLRKKDTVPQTTLSKLERERNIKDAFEVSKSYAHQLKKVRVFLFDDVCTTGATMKEAKKVLHEAGVREIVCVAFAG